MVAWGQRWQRLSKRQQLILLILVGVVALWAFDAVAFRPLLRGRLNALKRQAKAAEQQLVNATIASAQAGSVNRAFEAYQAYIKTAGTAEAELAAVLTEVESAVRESGMVLLNLRPVSEREAAPDRVSVTVETEASPAQLVQLLDRIQRSSHLLKVTELALRVSESQTLRSSLIVSKLLLRENFSLSPIESVVHSR